MEPDPEIGYSLNYWDAATNKVLALAGRGELRDYLDVLYIHQRHLSLGALVWAACGKDAGYTPQFLIEEAQRHTHYPASQAAKLQLERPIDLAACKKQWIAATKDANVLFEALPACDLGCFYLNKLNQPVKPDPASPDFPGLRRHFGSLRGAWPVIRK